MPPNSSNSSVPQLIGLAEAFESNKRQRVAGRSVQRLTGEEALTFYETFLEAESEHRSTPQHRFFDGGVTINPEIVLLLDRKDHLAFVVTRDMPARLIDGKADSVRNLREIGLIFTHKDHRKNGYATEALKKTLEQTLEQNAQSRLVVYMQTCIKEPSTLKFYSKAGFTYLERGLTLPDLRTDPGNSFEENTILNLGRQPNAIILLSPLTSKPAEGLRTEGAQSQAD